MQIKTKKELDFVLQADRMMNRGTFKPSVIDKLKNIFLPDHVINYLCAMRKVSYYQSVTANRGGRYLG